MIEAGHSVGLRDLFVHLGRGDREHERNAEPHREQYQQGATRAEARGNLAQCCRGPLGGLPLLNHVSS